MDSLNVRLEALDLAVQLSISATARDRGLVSDFSDVVSLAADFERFLTGAYGMSDRTVTGDASDEESVEDETAVPPDGVWITGRRVDGEDILFWLDSDRAFDLAASIVTQIA